MKNYRIYVNGQSYDVSVEEAIAGSTSPTASGVFPAAPANPAPAPSIAAPSKAGASTVKSPMPGTILSVKTQAGKAVQKGDVLLILEAMKMENEICAPANGTVAAVRVQAGQSVNTGDPLVDLA